MGATSCGSLLCNVPWHQIEDSGQRSDVRPAAPPLIRAEICVYLGGELWTEPRHVLPMSHERRERTQERLSTGARFVDVTIQPTEQVGPWQWAEIDVNINGWLFGAVKPLVWWAGEPTDWHSGLVRWEWPPYGGQPAMYCTVTIRRTS